MLMSPCIPVFFIHLDRPSSVQLHWVLLGPTCLAIVLDRHLVCSLKTLEAIAYGSGPALAPSPGLPSWLAGAEQIGPNLYFVASTQNRGFYSVSAGLLIHPVGLLLHCAGLS